MGLNDIQPWKNAYGHTAAIEWHRMDGSETFVLGEPVTLGADGDLNECGNAPTGAQFLGIALAPASYTIGSVASTKNPRTGANFTTGDLVPVAVLRWAPSARPIAAATPIAGAPRMTIVVIARATSLPVLHVT